MGHCWGTPWSPLRIFSFPSLGFFQILPGRMRVCCCWTRRKSRGWRRALCSLHDAVTPVGLVLLLLCHATPGSPRQTWSGPPAIYHLVISKVRTSSKKENPFHLPLFSTIVFSKDWGQEEKGGDRVWDGWMASSTQWNEFEQTLRDSEGQGRLACCSPRSCRSWTWLWATEQPCYSILNSTT